MSPRNLIESLDQRLAQALARFPADDTGWVLPLPQPYKLAERSRSIAQLFDEGKPAEPPSHARINALARLRRNEPDLTRKDWRLIAWGMCDDCGQTGKPIEVATMFDRIMAYFDSEFGQGNFSRVMWFGLLHSYFAYQREHPEDNPYWVILRSKLENWLPHLIQSQRRPKTWSTMLEKHRELLTPQAGTSLAHALFDGQSELANEVAAYLPIPDNSWLWQRVILEQISKLFQISDEHFYATIDAMLALGKRHPQQTDDVLSALLTRYARSAARDNAHDPLKEFALTQWGNPQVKSANRWAVVSDDVRRMVLQWFAKADLEHFFSLLQGEGGVDRARLDYWLRFVDQISYTRIVMGYDAYSNRDPNFVDFREKNKGRFSELQGGKTSNNAFVMRIGDYYFVEFSETGNACYVYAAAKLPFNPDHRVMQLQGGNGLKHMSRAADRILHNGDWQNRSDYLLRRLGIYPGVKAGAGKKATQPEAVPEWRPVSAGVDLKVIAVPPASSSAHLVNTSEITIPQFVSKSDDPVPSRETAALSGQALPLNSSSTRAAPVTRGQAARLAEELAALHNVECVDFRKAGGAFWVLEQAEDSELAQQLVALGFKFRARRGYWIN